MEVNVDFFIHFNMYLFIYTIFKEEYTLTFSHGYLIYIGVPPIYSSIFISRKPRGQLQSDFIRSFIINMTFSLMFFSVLWLLCLFARLFICTLWPPAGKGLVSWLSCVVSYCEFITFPLVSWARCGTCLYRFLILATLLTFTVHAT